MNDENSGGETNGGSAEKETSSVDSTERENTDEVPEYEGQWVALSDGESVESDNDSDGSNGPGTNDPADN